MKMGRPTKYKKSYGPLFVDVMEEVGIESVFCTRIGIHMETLRLWKTTRADFSDYYKKGKEIARANFLEKMSNAAWEADKHHVNNGLIHLLAINCHGLKTKDDKEESATETPSPLKVIIETQDGRKK